MATPRLLRPSNMTVFQEIEASLFISIKCYICPFEVRHTSLIEIKEEQQDTHYVVAKIHVTFSGHQFLRCKLMNSRP